jgi:hypothetical protein
MGDFRAAYPDYAATVRLDELRLLRQPAFGEPDLERVHAARGPGDSVARLKHSDGAPLVRQYGPPSTLARGAAGICLRTGCFCNPGAAEYAFGLTKRYVRGSCWASVLRAQGFLRDSMSTVDDYLDLVPAPLPPMIATSSPRATVSEISRRMTSPDRTRCPIARTSMAIGTGAIVS